ncbi:MAG: hypothetical protein RH942_03915 [Kiloniellaceae bacterium]
MKVLVLILLFPFAALLLPTTLVVATMMAPTTVAYIIDRSGEKSLAITVGLMNIAGTLPAIISLWTRGQSHMVAMDLIADPFVWVVAYGSAVTGWVMFGIMPTLVSSYFRMTTQTRVMSLVRRQKALIAEWGHAVAEGIEMPLPIEGEDAEEDRSEEGETEVTDAELVEPQASR